MGMHNTLSAIDWMNRNTAAGRPLGLQQLTVSGDSAGALGTQAWIKYILKNVSLQKPVESAPPRAVVIVDSYAGIFPDGAEGKVLNGFGACSGPLFDETELQEHCDKETIKIQDFVNSSMALFPQYPFAFIQAKEDIVQRMFYGLVDFMLSPTCAIMRLRSGVEIYEKTNVLFQTYAKNPNFVEYYVDGCEHTFTGGETLFLNSTEDAYYTAGTKGPGSGGYQDVYYKRLTYALSYLLVKPLASCETADPEGGSQPGVPQLSKWVNRFFQDGSCPDGACFGDGCSAQLFPRKCSLSL